MLLDIITVHAGSALWKRLLQSHTLGKDAESTEFVWRPVSDFWAFFVLTIHRRSIFLSKMEIYARGLTSMELTIFWGTEVCAWVTAQQTKAVVSGWIIKVGEILKAAFIFKHIMFPSLCALQTSLQPPWSNVCLILKVEVGLKQRQDFEERCACGRHPTWTQLRSPAQVHSPFCAILKADRATH